MTKFTEVLETVLGALLYAWTAIAVLVFAIVCSVVWIPVLLLVYIDEKCLEGKNRKAWDNKDLNAEIVED